MLNVCTVFRGRSDINAIPMVGPVWLESFVLDGKCRRLDGLFGHNCNVSLHPLILAPNTFSTGEYVDPIWKLLTEISCIVNVPRL